MGFQNVGHDWFSRFDVYWIQTNRQAKYIYRYINVFVSLNCSLFLFVVSLARCLLFMKQWRNSQKKDGLSQNNDSIFHSSDQIKLCQGYRCKSGIVLFARRITLNYAYSPFNKDMRAVRHWEIMKVNINTTHSLTSLDSNQIFILFHKKQFTWKFQDFKRNYEMLAVRYFPKGLFPRTTYQVTIPKVATSQICNFPRDNFTNVHFWLG